MKRLTVPLLVVTVVLGIGGLALAEAPRLAFHEEAGRVMGDVADQFRSLGAQLERHLRGTGGAGSRELAATQAERPLITYILDHRDELSLTPEQIARLEALRNDFAREQVRREADIRIAEMDLTTLMAQEMLDLSKVEAKIRDVSKLRDDLRIERLRTLEQGKAVLTADQRTKLRGMLGLGPASRRTAERGTRL